jgi:hypothetical protein
MVNQLYQSSAAAETNHEQRHEERLLSQTLIGTLAENAFRWEQRRPRWPL